MLSDKNSEYPLYSFYEDSTFGIPGFRFVRVDGPYELTKELHFHDFYEVFVVLEGEGHHTLDFVRHDIKNNQLFCIGKGQLHNVASTSNLKGYFMMFDSKFYARLFPDKSFLNSFSMRTTSVFQLNDEIRSQIKTLHLFYEQKRPFKNEIVEAQVKIVLAMIEELSIDESENKGTTDIVQLFFMILDAPSIYSRFSGDFSKKIGVTSNYLNECVKKQTGRSAQSWIKERLLLEAKRLLSHTDMSIHEIAMQLSFSDSASFCRFFKLKDGMSPMKWRTTYRVKKR